MPIYTTIFLFCIYLFWINNITLKNIFNETKEVIKGKKLFSSVALLYKTIKFVKNNTQVKKN
jgi:hypothetical protein